jgi:hypothetical protein
MDIRNFCHVETSSEVCEDEVSAPVEKRPRTELRNTDGLSDLEASQTTSGSEIDEDDFEDILGQPENVSILQAQKILTLQQKAASSTAATGPGDISQLPDDGPTQPGLKRAFHFPKSHGRRFIAEWFKKFPWLEYSVCENKVYCFTCRHFSTVAENTARPFVTEGFCQWKKCTGESQKNNRLSKHKNSQLHLDSATRYSIFYN